jgi:gliding motility-associated-like protein
MTKQKILITALLAIAYSWSHAQIFAGNDTIICTQSPVTLNATYNIATQGTTVTLTDDQYTPVVNIGFPFTYFGNTYTQCLISSNNYITFDLTNAGGYSPWTINNPIPSSMNPTNSIMCPWQDVYPPGGGCIGYATFGTAPNRVFVITFGSVAMFSCTNLQFTSQIKLYEGTNVIETHITSKPLCATWNGGAAIHGIQDAAGTTAFVVPGRNYPTQWTTSNEGYQFVPSGSSSYTHGFIPYNPSTFSTSTNTVNWYVGNTLVGTGTSITVNPSVTTSYIAELTTCGVSNVRDTVVVIVGQMTIAHSQTNVSCFGGSDGSAIATASGPGGPWDFTWADAAGNTLQTKNNVTSDTLTGLPAGTYTVTTVNTIGCIDVFSFTITQPAAPVSSAMMLENDSCSGASDAKAWVTAAGGTGPYTYLWNVLPPQTTDTVWGLGVGTYIVTITDSKGCTLTDTVVVYKDPAPVPGFTTAPEVLTLFDPECYFTDVSQNAVTWHWSFGDGDTSAVQNPVHEYESDGTFDVTLTVTNAIGCTSAITLTVTVEDFYTMYLPNSFTPNGDGRNETFGAYGSGILQESFELHVFNRWGNLVFSSTDIYDWWNGRFKNQGDPVESEVYVYVVKFRDFKNKPHKVMGHVTLIR